jgi:hypothetical protein
MRKESQETESLKVITDIEPHGTNQQSFITFFNVQVFIKPHTYAQVVKVVPSVFTSIVLYEFIASSDLCPEGAKRRKVETGISYQVGYRYASLNDGDTV